MFGHLQHLDENAAWIRAIIENTALGRIDQATQYALAALSESLVQFFRVCLIGRSCFKLKQFFSSKLQSQCLLPLLTPAGTNRNCKAA